MKFKIVVCIALLTNGFLFSQSKVGTVDSEYIISLMPEKEVVLNRAGEYGKKLDSSFATKMSEYNLKVEAFKSLSATVVDSIKQKKYTELVAMEQDLQKYKQNGTQLMQIKRNELMRPLYARLSKIIQEVAKVNGYTQVLTLTGNEFAYIDNTFDITLLVLKELGITPPPEKK